MYAFHDILQEQHRQVEQVEDIQVPRVIPRDRSNPFLYHTEEEFIQRYRLPKNATRNLVEDIEPRAPRVRNGRGTVTKKPSLAFSVT